VKGDSHRRRILVVQSEASVAADIAKSLEDAGYDVAGIAVSADDAIRAASNGLDLILMDISIRGNMDGIETAAQLRERLGTPVIYLTAQDDAKTFERARQTKPLAYLLKPLRPGQWLRAIAIALERADQEREFREHLDGELSIFATLLEASPDFIAIVSADGEMLFINAAGRRLVGIDPYRQLAGTHLSDYVVDSAGSFARETILPTALRDGRWEGMTRFKNWTTGAAVPVWQSVFFVSAGAGNRSTLSTKLAGTPGMASCFWLTARVDSRAESAMVTATPSAVVNKNSARILVAEDHPVNLEVLVGMLGELGYGADSVTDGLAAVEALKSVPYDLVLMDCEMPVLDGFEATRLIRNPETGALNPQVPIIAVTASAMAGDRETCIQAGMDDYLTKPVEPDSLERALTKWLSRPSPEKPSVSQPPKNVFCGSAVFDHVALLNRLRGNRTLAQNVLNGFLEIAPSQLANLRRTMQEHDLQAARREAHSLKGAAANISAPVLRGLALQAERAAAGGEWSNLDAVLHQMEDQLMQLKKAISGWRYSIVDSVSFAVPWAS
jgi:CheY-like chemotaxis protein/HPt (histidine-containing phosphotransfer) domain-containing protein